MIVGQTILTNETQQAFSVETQITHAPFGTSFPDQLIENRIFEGELDFPKFFWGIRPELKNHVGAPEAFYSGQFGVLIGTGLNFDRNSNLTGNIGLGFFQNLEQLRLKAYSRLPKVRSDVREYLKEKYTLKSLAYSYIFDPHYSKDYLFFGGIKLGLFEEM